MNAHAPALGDPLARFNLLDEAMPVMLAYIDCQQRYRYHNRAFREWLGLEAGEINGHTMHEVLGEKVYPEIAQRVAQALSGQAVHYQRTRKTRNGGAQRLFIHLVPRLSGDGKVGGLFAFIVNQARLGGAGRPVPAAAPAAQPVPVEKAQSLYDESIDLELTGWQNAADRIKSALKKDEFILYAQLVELRDSVHTKLGEAVGALETIRLDLLRLHAGSTTIQSITTHLGLAVDVSEEIGRLIAANKDVERMLHFPRLAASTPV